MRSSTPTRTGVSRSMSLVGCRFARPVVQRGFRRGISSVSRRITRRITTSCTGSASSTAATRSVMMNCGVWSRHPKSAANTLQALKSIRVQRCDGEATYAILDNLSAHKAQRSAPGQQTTAWSCVSHRPTAPGRTRPKPTSGHYENSCRIFDGETRGSHPELLLAKNENGPKSEPRKASAGDAPTGKPHDLTPAPNLTRQGTSKGAITVRMLRCTGYRAMLSCSMPSSNFLDLLEANRTLSVSSPGALRRSALRPHRIFVGWSILRMGSRRSSTGGHFASVVRPR